LYGDISVKKEDYIFLSISGRIVDKYYEKSQGWQRSTIIKELPTQPCGLLISSITKVTFEVNITVRLRKSKYYFKL